ncbi:MAG: serine/threonine protein kinase [Vicinamibacteria bacterium]|nr:serine/threonine protein kinase [Vicinamibacteria bacterium]
MNDSKGASNGEASGEIALPQDMAKLLDALGEGPRSDSLDPAPDESGPIVPFVEDQATEAGAADTSDSLVSLLESAATSPQWDPSPPPPSDGSRRRDDRRASRSRVKRPGVRFHALTPPEPDESALDLAAVVEEALGPSPRSQRSVRAAPSADHIFGPYRLLEKIATGGMAEVYRAKRTGVEGFEKVLAVKRILNHLSDNQEFVEMFVNEAKMVAGLNHPNIVQIFDLGRIGKAYFIAMEHVHGRDLRTIVRRTQERGMRIPLDLTVFIVSRVCQALEYAHRKRDDDGRALLIVHRDVSPQNILISFEGEVKLTDFGIARAAAKARTTDSGALRGKLLYMSPEQAWGKPMDRRSDIFSLGLIFYEMLTEQKPFMGGSQAGILEVVRQCDIAQPTMFNPRIPDRIERIVLKALARDPESRYQEAGEMYKDLDRVLYERPQPPTMAELARFMTVLFDERERGAPQPADEPIETPDGRESRLEMEFEAHSTPAAPRPAKPLDEQTSVKKLLRRLGIK